MNSLRQPGQLSVDKLQKQLVTKTIGRSILSYNEVTSTNTLGFKAAESGSPHGTVIVAGHQTAGKGRLGRTWHSPAGRNLYFSIVLTDTPKPSYVSWIPLLTGVALAESLAALTDVSVLLKWQNDIMIQDKKLAGVLCETKQRNKSGLIVVVGIGINVNSEKDDFPAELRDIATSLTLESRRQFDQLVLLANFLTNFETWYDQLLLSGPQALRHEYLIRCTTLHHVIEVQRVDGEQLRGMAVDIGDEGELHVTPSLNAGSSTPIRIRSGDVHHIR